MGERLAPCADRILRSFPVRGLPEASVTARPIPVPPPDGSSPVKAAGRRRRAGVTTGVPPGCRPANMFDRPEGDGHTRGFDIDPATPRYRRSRGHRRVARPQRAPSRPAQGPAVGPGVADAVRPVRHSAAGERGTGSPGRHFHPGSQRSPVVNPGYTRGVIRLIGPCNPGSSGRCSCGIRARLVVFMTGAPTCGFWPKRTIPVESSRKWANGSRPARRPRPPRSRRANPTRPRSSAPARTRRTWP